jgi:predicted DNA-binding transcriptional regulator AlpA
MNPVTQQFTSQMNFPKKTRQFSKEFDSQKSQTSSINKIGVHTMKTENQPRILRMKQLISYTSLSRGYIWQKINEGTFPAGYMISPGIRVWEKTQIDNWLDKRMGKEA